MRKPVLCLVLCLAALAVICAGGWHAPASAQAKPEYVGSQTCTACHKTLGQDWMSTIHGQRLSSPGRAKEESGCEACHGPGSAHLSDPDHKNIINPAKLKPTESAAACATCHSKDAKGHNWQMSTHSRAKMTCSSCHDVHKAKGAKALPKPQSELCLDCHKKERGQFMLTSHHPLLEGRIECSDCHNAHDGKQDFMLRDSAEKDLCVKCHREKEGPFVYEHGAISGGFGEGCISCHKPHGSANNDLQRLTGRGLCLQCHTDAHIGSASAGTAVNCTTCHRMLHGSDRDALFFR